jgi:hypothetical protein
MCAQIRIVIALQSGTPTMEDGLRVETFELNAEEFKGQKIMPLEDVDKFKEGDMEGEFVRFFAVRYPDPRNQGRKRWAIEALFYFYRSSEMKFVERSNGGASSVGGTLAKRSKWHVKEKRISHLTFPPKIIVDGCTFEEAQVDGQRRLVCCRGVSVPLAGQEFTYLGFDVLTPQELFQTARQFQASGKMDEEKWYRTFVNFVSEQLDDITPDTVFDKPINSRNSKRKAQDCHRPLVKLVRENSDIHNFRTEIS